EQCEPATVGRSPPAVTEEYVGTVCDRVRAMAPSDLVGAIASMHADQVRGRTNEVAQPKPHRLLKWRAGLAIFSIGRQLGVLGRSPLGCLDAHEALGGWSTRGQTTRKPPLIHRPGKRDGPTLDQTSGFPIDAP